MERNLRIAVFGQKRLSREGGVEIVVKELCTRMAQQGCQVTCYNRSGHHVSGAEYDDIDNTNYEGIRQKYVPTIEKKWPCSGKRIGFCSALQCIWKIRCGAYPCRGTGLLLMAAQNVQKKGGGYHPWR